jgi:hypothetical protein
LFLLAVLPLTGAAQKVNLSDSLSNAFQLKPTLTAKLDTRNSFITGNSAQVRGVKVGLSFGDRLQVGLGYNWLSTDFNQLVPTPDGTAEGRISFWYIAPYIDYVFYRKGNWMADIPVQLGFGRSAVNYTWQGNSKQQDKGGFILYEPTMVIEYQVLGLIGIGGGLGYRLMLVNNRELDQQFTSPVYQIRFRVIFSGLKQWWNDQQPEASE